MKRLFCLILAFAMALSLAGCKFFNKPDKPETTPAPTEAASTEEPKDTAAPENTEQPTEAPSEPPADVESAADIAFKELDLDIFRTFVTSGTDSYNQYIVSDPGMFGIDPADVTPGWGDLTYDSHVESMDYYREVLDELGAIDRGSLNEKNGYAYDALKRTFEVSLMFEDYYYYDEPLTPLNGLHTMLPLSMVCFNVRNLDDVENYLILIEDMERFLGQVEQFENEKAEQGLFMTEVALDQVVESCRSFAEKGSSSILITYFEEVLETAKGYGLSDSECASLRARNTDAVINHVLPAYSRLADALEGHRGDCSEFTGAVNLGEKALAYYELKTKDEGATMDDMDVIIEKLEDMADHIFYELSYAIYYGPDDILDKFGDPITFGSVDDNIDWLSGLVDSYYPEMPDYVLRYIEVPEDIADDFSPAAYLTPSFDDYLNNLMLINPTSEDSDDLLTIAHESIPGHMFQFLYTRSNGFSLSQQVVEPTGYAEGWTVFTENFVAKHCRELGKEFCTMMNTNSTFCNVFIPAYVSIMVNVEGWTMDDVEDYLADYGLEDAADIFYEYAITMPQYVMPYAIGYAYMLEIYNDADPKNEEQHKAFFEKYLSFGPNYMDMMLDYMSK
jgi:uncharacterized protein (DUF885 family)